MKRVARAGMIGVAMAGALLGFWSILAPNAGTPASNDAGTDCAGVPWIEHDLGTPVAGVPWIGSDAGLDTATRQAGVPWIERDAAHRDRAAAATGATSG